LTAPSETWSAARPLFWGFATLAVLVGGLGAWSVFTTLSGAIISHGQIEVAQNRQVVQHPDGGVVSEIVAREGMEVAAGEVLMRLDGSELQSELAIVEDQLLELGARHTRLDAQSRAAPELVFPPDLVKAAETGGGVDILAGQKSMFANQAEILAQTMDQRETRIHQIDNQIEGLGAQQDAISAQIGLLETELGTLRDLLDKGLTQSARVSALDRELAQLKGRLGELTSARAEAAGRITEIEIEMTAIVTQQREKAEAELRDVAASLSELEERKRALVEKMSRLDIRSPSSGLVLGLQVTTPNAVIRPADALMYIVPQDRPLLVAARVPVTHVDEVHSGQEVRLVFSALPARLMPELFGKVTLVSADALSDERTGTSYFRAEVALDPGALATLGEVQLVPGMPVDVYIRTGDRTPLSYLLKPFTDYFQTALRET
jgi:HlyD family secretion protein